MIDLTLTERMRLGLPLRQFYGEAAKHRAFSNDDYCHPKAKLYTIGDRSRTLDQWSREYGKSVETVRERLKRGMTILEALTKPSRGSPLNVKTITYKGRTMTLQQWADKLDLSVAALSRRLRNPTWTAEKALTRPRNKKRKKAKGKSA